MPLPLLLLAPVVVGSLWGVKKAKDAADDYSTAKEKNERARSIYKDAKDSLADCRQNTQSALEALGRRKGTLYKEGVVPAYRTIERIKNFDDDVDNLSTGAPHLGDFKSKVLQMEDIAFRMADAGDGGAAALGSGALAGVAAYGSVGLLGAASTGTAISSLSGAAATNATLAWLGGGAVAAGGGGIALGTAMLGGIVFAPALLVGGMIFASKAEEKKENARSNLAEARQEAELMKTVEVATRAIGAKARDVDQTLRRLGDFLDPELKLLSALVLQGETDYRRYSRAERASAVRCCSLVVTAVNLLEAPLLDKEGAITPEIRQTLRRAKAAMDKLGALAHAPAGKEETQ